MKKYFLLLLTFYIFHSAFSQNITFRHTFGGNANDNGRSVKQTIDGGYIIAGSTSSFGYGNSDVYVIKLDSLGMKQWSNVYGSANVEWAYSIVQTYDSNYAIAGITNGIGNGGYDVYLIKIDSTGNILWEKTFGGSDWDFVYSIQQTADSGFILAGETYSFGNGNNDVYLIKTDKNGNQQWQKTFGGNKNDYAKSVKQTFDGGYILAGATTSFGAGMDDVFIVKTNSIGDTLWTKTFGDTLDDWANDVVQTLDSGFAITGLIGNGQCGAEDFTVYALDTIGNLKWNFIGCGINSEEGISLIEKYNKNIVAIGYTNSFGAAYDDMVLYHLNPNGYYIFSDTYGGFGYEKAYSIIETTDSGMAFVGSMDSYGSGYSDIVIIKTDTLGKTTDKTFISYQDSVILFSSDIENSASEINFFPNPFQLNSKIFFPSEFELSNTKFVIYNLLGKKIITYNVNQNPFLIENKNDFFKGIYFFHIIQNDNIKYKGKFIAD